MVYYRMALSTPKDLLAKIRSGRFEPAYYFFGPEDFRIAEAEKYIAREFLPEKQIMTNFRKLDGRKTKLADLLAELSIYPMLGERQVFAVTDIQTYKPTELKKILALLQPPDPNRTVIFTTPAARMPKKNSAFVKNMSAIACAVVFERLLPRDMEGIIVRKLQQAELTIDREALTLLTEMIDGNRGALDTEVDKLINYCEAGKTVSVDDIRLVCSGFEIFNIFELADDVVRRDIRKVLKHVDSLMTSGDASGSILFNLGQHFHRLYLVKCGKPLPNNMNWLAPRLRPQAQRFSLEQLEQSIIDIATTTSDIRRQKMKPRLAMETLVLKLAGVGNG